jgi:hypothetical protein
VKGIEHGFEVVFYRLEELLAALFREADLAPARLHRETIPIRDAAHNRGGGVRADESPVVVA